MSDEHIVVMFGLRDDGGLRAWSDDVPGLVLSHADPNKVISDVAPALAYILSCKHGCPVQVHEAEPVPEPVARLAAVASRKVRPIPKRAAARPAAMTFAAEPCYG